MRIKNIKQIYLVIIVVHFLMPTILSAQDIIESRQAPFGLIWGESIEETKKKIGKLTKIDKTENLVIIRTKEVPKVLSGTEVVALTFHEKHGLIKIMWIGENIIDSARARESREKYEYIKGLIVQKYGEYKRSRKDYQEGDEYYEFLAGKYTPPLGIWFDTWESKKFGAIRLTYRETSLDSGYVKLLYESPFWKRIVLDSVIDYKKQDSDAI